MNKQILKGKLGSDPELKYTANGKAVASVGLATTENYTDASGAKQAKTTWHNLKAWGKLAEVMGQYCKKGSELLVEGKFQTDTWEKDGQKRTSFHTLVEKMEFCGSKKKSDDRQSEPPSEDDMPF